MSVGPGALGIRPSGTYDNPRYIALHTQFLIGHARLHMLDHANNGAFDRVRPVRCCLSTDTGRKL